MYHLPVRSEIGGAGQRHRPVWGDEMVANHYYLEFGGVTPIIDCGSDASLDNLPLASFTFDCWLYRNTSVGTPFIVSKGLLPATSFWYLEWTNLYDLLATFWGATAGDCNTQEQMTPDVWHHLAFLLGADMKPYFAIDGTWCTYWWQNALVGYFVDGAGSMYFANYLPTGAFWLDGNMAWARFSTGDRFGLGVNFTPPPRCTAPAVDGTTIELWTMDEGAGAVAAASVVAGNNGTLTSCTWRTCQE